MSIPTFRFLGRSSLRAVSHPSAMLAARPRPANPTQPPNQNVKGSQPNQCHFTHQEKYIQVFCLMQNLFKFIPTNHIAWVSKVGVAVAKTDSSISQSYEVNLLVGGDRRPVLLSNTKHPKSGYPSIWRHNQMNHFIPIIYSLFSPDNM